VRGIGYPPPLRRCHLAEVRIGENESFEAALRRFNKKVQQAGILAESRRREAFENAAEKKKRKDAKRKKPMGGAPRGV
jgi:small subunit ribosomal protein S21